MKAFSVRFEQGLRAGAAWGAACRAIAVGVLIANPWLAMPALAETGPGLSVAVTGQHRLVDGKAADNAVYVQLTVTPRVGSAVATNDSEYNVSSEDNAYRLLPVQADGEVEVSTSSDVPLDPLERDELLGESDATSEGRRYRGPKTNQEAALSSAPFVLSPAFTRQVIDAAMTAEGVKTALGRLESLGYRAKMSAILPEVRFRAGRDVDRSLRLAPTETEPYRYTETGGVSLILEGSATFRLNRLLFANEELSIERLKLAQARERQRLTALVLDELVTWEHAYRVSQTGTPQASRRAMLQLHESALRLDVLTNGWFSVHEPRSATTRSPAMIPQDQGARAKELQGTPPRVRPASGPAKGETRGNASRNSAELRVEGSALEQLATSR